MNVHNCVVFAFRALQWLVVETTQTERFSVFNLSFCDVVRSVSQVKVLGRSSLSLTICVGVVRLLVLERYSIFIPAGAVYNHWIFKE